MKFIFILLLVVIELFATQWSDAISFYNKGKYIPAYEKFYLLHVKNKTDIKVSFYLAKTLYNLGEYKKAQDILLPLYKKEQTNIAIQFYLAKIYYEQKQYKKSKALFEQLQQKPYKAEATQYLEKIKTFTTLHKFFFLVSLGMTYDNNTHNNTYEPTTNYELFVLNNDTHTVSDIFIDKMLYINHTYKMPSHTNIHWHDTLMLFHRNGMKHADQDMLYSSFTSGPIIVNKDYIIEPKIILNDLNYASRHYMYSYGIGLKFSKKFFSNTLQTNLEFSAKKDKYIHTEDKTKDDNVMLYGLNLIHTLHKNNIFKYTVSYRKMRKEFGNRADISKDEYRYGLEYDRKFYTNYMLALNTTYEKRNYTNTDPSLGTRNDKKMYYTGTISKGFKKFYNLSVKYKFIDNKSSINTYSYKKSTVGITLSRYF